jgi:hypothetical protein
VQTVHCCTLCTVYKRTSLCVSVFLSAVISDCTLHNRYRKTLLLLVTVQTVLMHDKPVTTNSDSPIFQRYQLDGG